MFYPGETINFEFEIPFSPSEIEKAFVSFGYRTCSETLKEKLFDKVAEPIAVKNVKNSLISIALTENESLQLEDNRKLGLQLNIFTEGGLRYTSSILSVNIGEQYYKDIIPVEESEETTPILGQAKLGNLVLA